MPFKITYSARVNNAQIVKMCEAYWYDENVNRFMPMAALSNQGGQVQPAVCRILMPTTAPVKACGLLKNGVALVSIALS